MPLRKRNTQLAANELLIFRRLRECVNANASVELSWHVGFTPDFGRMVATQELTLRAKETSGPGNCHSYARVHRRCCTRQALSTELVTTLPASGTDPISTNRDA